MRFRTPFALLATKRRRMPRYGFSVLSRLEQLLSGVGKEIAP